MLLRVWLRLVRGCTDRRYRRLRIIALLMTIAVALWVSQPPKWANQLRIFSIKTPNTLNISSTSSSSTSFLINRTLGVLSVSTVPSMAAATPVLPEGGYLSQKAPMVGTGQGNLMFMYASMLGIAHRKKMTAVYPQDGPLRKIFQLTASSESPSGSSLTVNEAKACAYDSKLTSFENRQNNMTVVGYLQSWKYFSAIENHIRQEFTFNSELKSQAQSFLANISRTNFSELTSSNETLFIGVHIRRRDMLLNYNIVRGYTVATVEYLVSAVNYFLSRFPAKLLVFVVCADDVVWARGNFPRTENSSTLAVFSEKRNAAEDMAILTACNHSIVTVGTYGWWSGYLTGGITTYYKNFPSPRSHIDNILVKEDYFPHNWIGL